ncbi:phage minor head protein [Sphingomonas naphthae]|uniref:Phage minor head protein n=1 Tax=Sphingomonas naphthae TaxID=1813468 RepID=A0ABY7TFY7_9SPHN|nr:phage minor head protein [Sphingomonas naphthae]WCT72064.1 phage minor head protein [Sphingomonas naphthae]
MVEPLPIVSPVEALRFFRAKGLAGSFAWQDVWNGEHARAFTVAKVMSRDLLEDIRAALDEAIAGGQTLETFRANLRPTLEAKGWWGRKPMRDPETGELKNVQLGSPRRLKTIFEVNMRSAYAAGRWERIERNKKAFPYLRYMHSLKMENARPQHVAWHGTIRPVDDDWWDTHYGPCGWGCACTAQPVNQRVMERRGWAITEQPVAFPKRQYVNPRTGEVSAIEQGISPGFNFNIGKAYLDPLAPSHMPGLPIEGDATAAAGDVEAGIDAFLSVFGIKDGKARIVHDRDGFPLAIGRGWFRTGNGRHRLPAAPAELARAAQAIARPTSSRWTWVRDASGRARLTRRYVRREEGATTIAEVSGAGWRFVSHRARAA